MNVVNIRLYNESYIMAYVQGEFKPAYVLVRPGFFVAIYVHVKPKIIDKHIV